jgi:hypothetical protein
MISKRLSELSLHPNGPSNEPPRAGSRLRRRVLAIAIGLVIVAVVPRTGRAEFVSAAGQSAQAGLLASAPIESDGASLDVCWGLFGWSSGSEQREPAPAENLPVEDNRRPLDAFGVCALGNSTGMGTSSPPSGGATSGSIGILNGSWAPWLSVCSGTMLCGNVLVPPAPPPSSLLDPPKGLVCGPLGLRCC